MEIYSKSAVVLALMVSFASSGQANEIHGRILLEPPLPVIQKVKMESKRHDRCEAERFSESLILSSSGEVQNAVITLNEKAPAMARPAGPLILNQKNCSFTPHVLVVPAGASFKVASSDPMDHDVRGFDGVEMLFRFEIPPGSAPVEKSFGKPGIYAIRCGFHTWMHAFVVALPDIFYAVSQADGKFILKDVPPGRHVLKIWHETLGETEIPVMVTKAVEEVRYVFPNGTSIHA